MRPVRSAARALALGLAAHTAVNARLLRRPPEADEPRLAAEWISVLVPVRDEAERLLPLLRTLTSQVGLDAAAGVEFLVLDDDSGDGTAALAEAVATHEPRLRVIRSTEPPPPGWLGKPWACARLAAAADPRATVLIYLDADVRLAPQALTRSVTLLRAAGLQVASPYPRQIAVTPGERLVQPLLQWSWLASVPLRAAETSTRPSLALANGQFLVVDAAHYRKSDGHGAPAVRGAVLDDLALARHLRSAGARGGMVDGTAIATCRMYESGAQLRAGYTKSLWAAGGGNPAASLAQVALLAWLYLRPDPICYAAGVASRLLSARRTGGRELPDALAHPVSIAYLAGLTGLSWARRRSGDLRWKGRPVVPAAG